MAIYTYYPDEEPAAAGQSQYRSDRSAEPMARRKLFASAAAAAIGLPLLAATGLLVLLPTAALLAVSSPALLFFSPLLVPAGLALAGSLAGFGTALAMAVGGVWHLRMALRSVRGRRGYRAIDIDLERTVRETVTESMLRVVEEEKRGADGEYFRRKVVVLPPEDGTVQVN